MPVTVATMRADYQTEILSRNNAPGIAGGDDFET